MYNRRVILGMSGGVDSSLSAALLLEQGYEVTGFLLAVPHAASPLKKAKSAADSLGIPLIVCDVREAFDQQVIRRFVTEYLGGRTPNPCVFCNPAVKFAALCQAADERGAQYVATGHYARVQDASHRHLLLRAGDKKKDQSYMLYRLSQNVLSRLLLPLEQLTKPEVRTLAEEHRLASAGDADSQEICFVPDGNYAEFIKRYTGDQPVAGDFITASGKILGRHKGIVHYTVGQRKNLGISLGVPAFVAAIDSVTNTVTLSTEESDLFRSELIVTDPVWIPFDTLSQERRITAKIRHTTHEYPGIVFPSENGAIVRFDTPVRAPAPGQSCVLYDGDVVLGGGYIRSCSPG